MSECLLYHMMLIDTLNRECHVWFTNPDIVYDADTVSACESLLSNEEHTRYKRFYFASDQQRFLISHALVRQTLSRYFDLLPQHWTFTRAEHGKPEIANQDIPPLRFNLTHTQGLTACMISLTEDCGIDAERVKHRHDHDAIARKVFSKQECAELQQLHGAESLRYFYTHWTLREAYVKAKGIGLSFPTQRMTFSVDAQRRTCVCFNPEINDNAQKWRFELLELSSQHSVATALNTQTKSEKRIITRRFEL